MAAIPFQPMMESRPIREIAYEVLKHAIITGEIPAGERIVETEYADRLHISRTPLREALRKLERDGLVEYVQRRGVIVRAFTIADVEEIYTIRNALEMLTLPAIIQKATADDIAALRDRLHEMDGVMASRDFETLSPMARAFHRQMTEICGQNRILRVIEGEKLMPPAAAPRRWSSWPGSARPRPPVPPRADGCAKEHRPAQSPVPF